MKPVIETKPKVHVSVKPAERVSKGLGAALIVSVILTLWALVTALMTVEVEVNE